METVCGLGQLAMGKLPAMHVKLTVTGELFQPLELGTGLSVAAMEGGTRTVNEAPLLAKPFAVTTTEAVPGAVMGT